MIQKSHTSQSVPEFLVKSTLGCSIVVILTLTPFLIGNILEQHYLLSFALFTIIVICGLNAWHGFYGRYRLSLNTYFVSPIGAITIIYAIFLMGVNATYWSFMITLSYYFVLPQRRATYFNIATLIVVIPSAWYLFETATATRFSAALIGTNLFAFLSMRQVYLLHNLLREQAIKDPLTGLLNRSTLDESLQLAIAQNQRNKMPMSIICFDIDHFKTINDTFGHAVGDNVLVDLATILKARIRDTDRMFRIGGEEFLILTYNTDEKQAASIAENLRKQIESSLITNGRNVTASFGVSQLTKDITPQSWMHNADEKLYIAKESGRNQVVI